MKWYLLNRLAMLILVSLGVTSIVFVVTRVLPQDSLQWAAGPDAGPEQIAQLRKLMKLDRPLWEQYVAYIRDISRGNLGFSIYTRRPVVEDLIDFFPATLELAVYGMAATIALSIPLGVMAAVRRGEAADTAIGVFSTLGAALPVFWFGLVLQYFLYGMIGWFPAGERLSAAITFPHKISGLLTVDAFIAGRWDALGSALYHLALPTLTLALQRCAVVARMVRTGMLEVLQQDYIRTARAKGLSERRVIYVHALRNASLSVLTVLGLQFGFLLGGTVLVEVIFQWPGIGQYAVRSLSFLDYSPVAGVALLVSFAFVLVNLAVDLFYAVLDPRIRY